MSTTLIVAAHPDDEVLGCGGTIAKLVDEGEKVHVAFLADGVSSRDIDSASVHSARQARRAAASAACDILGVRSISFGDFPDNRMDSVALLDVVKTIERLIAEHKPETVFTHHGGDVNVDHRRVHEAIIPACRPQGNHVVTTLLFFEVPSSTEWQLPGSGAPFMPNWFVDVSTSLDRKLTALDAYVDEIRSWPHPRSRRGVEYLARWRGAIIGVDAAEAFILGRRLS